jgi:hypothetical protein
VVGLVGTLTDGDTQTVDQRRGHFASDRDVPAADEEGSDGSDRRIEPGRDAAFNAPQIGLGRRHVLLAGEQQRDVDRDAGEDRLLDGRQTLRCAGDLDEEIRPPRPVMQRLGRGQSAGGVVGQERRHLQRDPSIDAIGALENRLEQLGGPGQVLQRQVEEQILARSARAHLLSDRVVVSGAVLDGVIEDRGIGGEPGPRKLADVVFQRPAAQQIARDVVEPNALAQTMQLPGYVHRVTSKHIVLNPETAGPHGQLPSRRLPPRSTVTPTHKSGQAGRRLKPFMCLIRA